MEMAKIRKYLDELWKMNINISANIFLRCVIYDADPAFNWNWKINLIHNVDNETNWKKIETEKLFFRPAIN